MIKLKDILSDGLYMGPAKNAKVDIVHVRHKTSEKELVIVKSALKKYNKMGYLAYNPKDKYKGGSLKWDVPMGMEEGKFREEIQKMNEVDFGKVKLPSAVNRFLNKFVQSMKDTKLIRIKRSAILYKVINASGMSPQQLMADIQKIKKELK